MPCWQSRLLLLRGLLVVLLSTHSTAVLRRLWWLRREQRSVPFFRRLVILQQRVFGRDGLRFPLTHVHRSQAWLWWHVGSELRRLLQMRTAIRGRRRSVLRALSEWGGLPAAVRLCLRSSHVSLMGFLEPIVDDVSVGAKGVAVAGLLGRVARLRLWNGGHDWVVQLVLNAIGIGSVQLGHSLTVGTVVCCCTTIEL